VGLSWVADHVHLTKYLHMILSMGTSWSIYFGIRWIIRALFGNAFHGACIMVLVAFCTTLLALVIILGVDKMADYLSSKGNEGAEKVLRKIMRSLNVLVGFAWEQSFDVSVEKVSSQISAAEIFPWPECWSVLLLSLLLSSVVLPVWKKNLLGAEMEIEEEEESESSGSESEEEKSEEGHSNRGLGEPLLEKDQPKSKSKSPASSPSKTPKAKKEGEPEGGAGRDELDQLRAQLQEATEEANRWHDAKIYTEGVFSELLEQRKARAYRTNELHRMVDQIASVAQQLSGGAKQAGASVLPQ